MYILFIETIYEKIERICPKTVKQALKTPKVDSSEPCDASSNNVVPSDPSNNVVHCDSLNNDNEVPTNPSNNDVTIDHFTGMHPAALDHSI